MVAITRDGGYDLVEGGTPASAIAGIVHGIVFVIPVWTFIGSIVLVAVLR